MRDRYLLDTHIFLWSLSEPERLSENVRTTIASAEAELFFSAAAALEIVIKHRSGKLDLPIEPAAFIPSRLTAMHIVPLDMTMEHTLAISLLPRHHADPFDRMMIAQAQVEGLTFVTADAIARRYPIRVLGAA
ncbi:MAG TPA: type II toxin-antitoxin system VapC family toxin [Candidatus Acidoferrales bacterium]|nr:type II toxin-antitoxin system VapC family toxin [Candidatus Acidoferrales bacterium]